MCLMIAKPAGSNVPEEYLRNGFDSNPDGAGYAFINTDGKLLFRKGIFNFDEFIECYNEEVPDGINALIHFRLATHGSTSEVNCHPFDVGVNMMMAHNGIIPIETEGDESDTRAFLRKVIQPALVGSPSLIRNTQWKANISAQIGGSKLAFISARPEHRDDPLHIINPQLGVTDGAVWYSNSGYRYGARSWAGYPRTYFGSGWHGDDSDDVLQDQASPDTVEIDLDALECDMCGCEIFGRFTLDRNTGLVGCSDCMPVRKGDTFRIRRTTTVSHSKKTKK